MAQILANLRSSTKRQLPGVLSLLGETWTEYKARATIYVSITALGFFMMIIGFLAFLGMARILSYLIALISSSGSMVWLAFITPFIIGILVVILAFFWMQVALLMVVKQGGDKINILAVYKESGYLILPYLWLSILASLIIAGGLTLLIITGVVAAVWLSLSIFVLVFENLHGFAALEQSREYIRGRWWYVFECVSFIFFLGFILSLLISYLVNLASALPITNILFQIFLIPLYVLYLYKIYTHLSRRPLEPSFIHPKRTRGILRVLGIIGLIVIILYIISLPQS